MRKYFDLVTVTLIICLTFGTLIAFCAVSCSRQGFWRRATSYFYGASVGVALSCNLIDIFASTVSEYATFVNELLHFGATPVLTEALTIEGAVFTGTCLGMFVVWRIRR